MIDWEQYTDHEPVEIAMRLENWYRPQYAGEVSQEAPDYRKMFGIGEL